MAERVFLVADPDPLQRQLVDLLLADEGAEMVGVSTARALLEYLRERTPTLIVVAQELPDLEGTAVASRVKAVARLTQVPLIITVNTEGQMLPQGLREQAASAGADLLLPKPLGDKNFRDRARRLMSGTARRRPGPGEGSTKVIEETIRDLSAAPNTKPSADGAAIAASAAAGAGAAAAGQQAREAALTAENERLRREVAQLRMQLDTVRTELAELKREPQQRRRRGPFGRRRD